MAGIRNMEAISVGFCHGPRKNTLDLSCRINLLILQAQSGSRWHGQPVARKTYLIWGCTFAAAVTHHAEHASGAGAEIRPFELDSVSTDVKKIIA